jgi:hypothetical protein
MAYTNSVPDTAARPLDWQARARCRDVADPDMFFKAEDEAEAKRTCFACPVLVACQSWVTGRERGMSVYARDDAVIAGLTPSERYDLDPTVQKPPVDPEPDTTGDTSQRKRKQARHGTRSRYRSGCRCEPCKAANREYVQELKRRKETEQAATPEPSLCPSPAGYRRHLRRDERACDGCRRAYAQDRAARRARQRGRAVYDLWAQALPDSEIAARLGIGVKAVRTARDRLGLIANEEHNRRQLLDDLADGRAAIPPGRIRRVTTVPSIDHYEPQGS